MLLAAERLASARPTRAERSERLHELRERHDGEDPVVVAQLGPRQAPAHGRVEAGLAGDPDPLADGWAQHVAGHVGVDHGHRLGAPVEADQVGEVEADHQATRRPDGLAGHHRGHQPQPGALAGAADRRAAHVDGVHEARKHGDTLTDGTGLVAGGQGIAGPGVARARRHVEVREVGLAEAQDDRPHVHDVVDGEEQLDDLDLLALAHDRRRDLQALPERDRPHEVGGEPADGHRHQRGHVLQAVPEQGEDHGPVGLVGVPPTLDQVRADVAVAVGDVQGGLFHGRHHGSDPAPSAKGAASASGRHPS